jgi:serine/threonine protein kinase
VLEHCDSCPELNRWQQLREKDISVDFRRPLKFNSDLADLTAYVVDISSFVEGSVVDGVFSRGCDDDCLIVVESVNLSDSIDNKEVETEIEKEINLLHPCIAAPIGFLFPSESSGLRELKIVRLFLEGCSLSEVISANPVWWTPTMKAKAVVGIALALRFAHSLGVIHGNLNSNNIRFDRDNRIQITNFGLIHLEVQEGKTVAGKDIFCEGWTPQVDVLCI